jgi:hypothetical protein
MSPSANSTCIIMPESKAQNVKKVVCLRDFYTNSLPPPQKQTKTLLLWLLMRKCNHYYEAKHTAPFPFVKQQGDSSSERTNNSGSSCSRLCYVIIVCCCTKFML